MDIIQLGDRKFAPYLAAAEIQQRVAALGQQVTSDYQGKQPVLLCILNGAFAFAADLAKHVNLTCEISFVKLASYSGTQSSGTVKELIGLDASLRQKPVIIVEDIVDSGNTLLQLLPRIHSLEPESLRVCALLVKPHALQNRVKVDYTGFEIPDDFIVGYGLDYNGLGRNLQDIFQAVPG
jgi:hypoxanthine phosphoribosyltransferase